ncbi:hypothetical protein NSA56_13455 [Oceanobacillus caeni]|uniref:DUF3139 domain-containing protein n=1 Tax=Oceanobacillus caeni TaxID=405946 RepID=A0ABR5MJB1_9BACI|nr:MULTISPECIES: hypothetical protein [Bacillaceae]KKE77837.1 hypothetical protein WH51_15775 [Bacilli bacterium VT-13-104]PZD81377.1 hypothetical protein DEJ64_17565 [Bacilli bacterium]KPH74598.1 hypothetical protein AFL42_09630 [Oceanobacillus caeni]MBU8791890.1 hypothetical protein [Oceanobacillus caeni]MCR1835389.1 hypothetical protein [Oceanobacillus caeni]
MKKILLAIGVIAILGFVAYLEKPENNYHGFVPDLHVDSTPTIREEIEKEIEEESIEAYAHLEQESTPAMSSVELELVDTYEEDGYMVEKYRKYEVYRNDDGVIVKKEPTSNYEFLKYKIDESSESMGTHN